MADLLEKYYPQVGTLFKIKPDNGMVVMTVAANKHVGSVRLKKDTILLLTNITKATFEASFSIDYATPASWTCAFLYEGKYVLHIFENNLQKYTFYENLEALNTQGEFLKDYEDEDDDDDEEEEEKEDNSITVKSKSSRRTEEEDNKD